MRLVNVLLLICMMILIVACGSGTGNNSVGNDQDGVFNASDYAGKWSFLSWSGPMYGSLDVDDAGQISSGEWTVMGESFGEYAAGMFTIVDDDTGSFSGYIFSPDINTIISEGQMGMSKDIMAFASMSNDPGIYISVKTEGAFDFSDLQGTWYFAAPDGSGTFNMDNTGNIIDGNYKQADTASHRITGGKLDITNQGIISGHFNTGEPNKYTIQYSQMNSGKDIIVAAYLNMTSSGKAFFAIKREGTFSMSDLEGKYKMYHMSDDNAVALGSIELNAVGKLLNGNWIEIEAESGMNVGNYTDGSIVFHDIMGVIAKTTINSSNGEALSLESGQMNSDKNAALVKTNSGLILLLKTP